METVSPGNEMRISLEEAAEMASVVIPARNEERFIGPCLDSVLAQTYANLEIIVVDGNSSDRTAAIVDEYATRFPQIRLLHNPRRIVPVSLNIGARAARGKWFVRVDAHATVVPDYVERAVRHLESGRWGGVGGRVVPIGLTPAGRSVAAAMNSRFGIGNAVHHYGREPVPTDHVPFPAYPRALIEELGGWDERLAVNQDFEFDYRLCRAGYPLLYDPALEISYVGQQSISGIFRQFRRYGRGKARVVLLHPRSMHTRHLVAPGLVAALTCGALAALRRPVLGMAAAAPYAVGLGLASALTARQVPDTGARLRLPITFAAMHLGWGMGFWEGLARGAGTRGTPIPSRQARAPSTSS